MCAPLLAAIPMAATVGGALGTSAAAGGLVIAGIAASGAAAGLQYMGQKQAADSSNNFQQYQYDQAQRLANENLLQQYKSIAMRQQEERAAASQQVQKIQEEGFAALGEAAVASGDSGVYGNSVSVLMDDFRRQQTESISNSDLNYAMRSRQIQASMAGMQGQAESQMIRAMPQYQSAPSIFSPILQTAGAGLSLAGNMAGPGFRTPEGAAASNSGPTFSYTGSGGSSPFMKYNQTFGSGLRFK